MSVVRINAITVPAERAEELERRLDVIQHEEASGRGPGSPGRSEPGPERPGAQRRERIQES